ILLDGVLCSLINSRPGGNENKLNARFVSSFFNAGNLRSILRERGFKLLRRSSISIIAETARYNSRSVISWKINRYSSIAINIHGVGLIVNRVNVTADDHSFTVAHSGLSPSLPSEVSPMIFVPNQLVGAPPGTNVTIDCHTEAYPRAMSYWFLGDEMILSNEKYTTNIMENSYRAYMRLTIRNLQDGDFGNYRCISKNSLGETEGSIRLYAIPKPSAAPKATEIKSSANKEGESLVEYIALSSPEIDLS
ncbi:unnamed protein product, partial [Heterotrigona itama]